MDNGNVNPYAPPETPIHAVETEHFHVTKGSRVLSLAAGLHSFAYICFTILLLTASDPGDREAGRYFLLNIPALIALVVYIRRSRRLGAFVGTTFTCLHVAITILMFRIDAADWRAIVVINAIVMAPILVIILLAWAFERLSHDCPNRSCNN